MIHLWLGCSAPTPVPDVPFELPVADPARVRFAAIGDTGKGNEGQRRVAAALQTICQRQGCDFVLMLGDNLYPDGMVEEADERMDAVTTEMYRGVSAPFLMSLGNHDWGRRHYVENAERQVRWASEQQQYHLPARHYRLQAGPVELWALDTDTVFWEGAAPQAAWLERTLSASEADWKVVFGHHPYRSDGPHGNAGAYEGWSYVPYVSGASLRELFEEQVVGRADLYLSGHDHNLQAFSHDGLELVVSGAGASRREVVDRGNHPDLAFSSTGLAWIELSESYTVEIYDQDAALLGRRTVQKSAILQGR